MKKFIFFISFLAGFQLFSFAQGNYSKWNGKTWEQLDGNGKMVQLTPTVTLFSSIESNNINLQLKVEAGAGEYAVHVSIDDNLKDFFRCTQEGSTIKLSMDLGGGKYPRWLSTSNIVVTVKAPSLERLTNLGNSKVDISLEDQVFFNLSVNGNPEISITGKTKQLNLNLTGNGSLRAGGLSAEKITLTSNGNANIELNAKEVIEKSVKGNNDIVNLFYSPRSQAAVSPAVAGKLALPLIKFKIKNNTQRPARLSVVYYRPDEKGNATYIFTLGRSGTESFRFPVGTKVYLANAEQVNTVMSGVSISSQPPFLVVKKEDEGNVFPIK